ncbi:hypothetical protein GYMLUDRAFT_170567, partial [Collybiopsis luxurians FD-317 M1]
MNVPTLNPTGRNWAIFSLRFVSGVQGKGWWDHFTGAATCPVLSAPTTTLVTAMDSWEKDKAAARNLLLSKVPDSVALKLSKHTSIADAWSALVTEYTKKS